MTNPLDSLEITVSSHASRGEVAEITHVLGTLLSDYSAKLTALTEEYEGIRLRYWLGGAVWLVVFSVISLLADKMPQWTTQNGALWWFVMVIMTGIPAVLFMFHEVKKSWSLRRNVKAAGLRVERVIRAASQFQEHGKVAELDFTRRLELNLRLGEAEAALRYSHAVVRDVSEKSAGADRAKVYGSETVVAYNPSPTTQHDKTAPVH